MTCNAHRFLAAGTVFVTLALPACVAEVGFGEGADPGVLEEGLAPAPISALRGLSGSCLDVNGASSANGAKVQLWSCNGTGAQRWWLENGVVTAVGGKCVDVSGWATADGTKIQIWDCNGGGNQKWSYVDGQLRGLGGKCATVSGGATANGTKIVLSTCVDSTAQRFAYVGGQLVTAGGKCVDVAGSGSSANGNALQIWDCAGTPQQRFVLSSMQLHAGTGGCLDVTGAQTQNGTKVQQWACTGAPQQRWTLNGSALTGLGGKCLDISGGTTADGTQAQIWDCTSPLVPQQQWFRSDRSVVPAAPLAVAPSTVAGSCKMGGYCARSSATTAHSGVDYPVAAGTTVYAMCDADVVLARTAATNIWDRFTILRAKNCGGYPTLYLYYGHIDAKAGLPASVKRGDPIGTVATWPGNAHLHLGMRTSYEASNWGYYPIGVSTSATCGVSTDSSAADNVREKALAAKGWIDPHSFGVAYGWWGAGVAIAACP